MQYRNVTPQATSTNMNTSYLRSNFIPTGKIRVNGKDVTVLDIANDSYLNVIKRLTPTNLVAYKGEPITTFAYNQSGNTSCWWMHAIINGVMHPLAISDGQQMFVADIATAIDSTAPPTASPAPTTVVF